MKSKNGYDCEWLSVLPNVKSIQPAEELIILYDFLSLELATWLVYNLILLIHLKYMQLHHWSVSIL